MVAGGVTAPTSPLTSTLVHSNTASSVHGGSSNNRSARKKLPLKKSVSASGGRVLKTNAANKKSAGCRNGNDEIDAATVKAEAWEKFKNSIAKYARTNDRRMMIRALKDCPRLRIVPMDPIDAEMIPRNDQQWNHCEIEVSKTHVRINGATMGAPSVCRNNKKEIIPNREMMEILKKMCDHLTFGSTQNGGTDAAISSDELYRELLLRFVRSKSSADAFFQLNALLGCNDLVVQPPKKAGPLPTDLTIYKSQGGQGDGNAADIHAVVVTRHPFGLFRKSDLTGGSPSVASISASGGKRPWVRLIAEVYERVNFSTGASVRYCSVKVQDKL